MSLFFALWPDDEIRRQILECRDQLKAEHRGVSGSWFSSDCYHLTVQDISLQATMTEQAIAAASKVRAEAFDLLLDYAAGFENPNGAHRWMLLSKTTPPGLRELRRDLLGCLRNQGLAPKPGTGRPHLSLHYNAGRQLPERPVPPLAWAIGEFVLLQGETGTKRGFHYRVLGRWPLAKRREPDHAPQLDLWDN